MKIPSNRHLNRLATDAVAGLTSSLPLADTKFTPPTVRGRLLPRPHLLKQLSQKNNGQVVLVNGCAGFGKTSLLTQYAKLLEQQQSGVAWLTLDPEDNTPERFLRCLDRALQPKQDHEHQATRNIWQISGMNATLNLAHLLNDITRCKSPRHLIMDDFHFITDQEVLNLANFLLQNLPHNLHVTIAGRTEFPLAVYRLQTLGIVSQLSSDDLRLTPDEARQYLEQTAGIQISEPDLRRLLAITDGWITGLKMATMLPELKTSPGKTIDQLSHGIRAVSRYFDEIVFHPLPDSAYEFLLKTCILDELQPELCDALTGQENAAETIEWLERKNYFISALDEHGTWFRYHSLFAESLRTRLRRRKDIDARILHERASIWFATNNFWGEAVRHALKANRPENTLQHAEKGARSIAQEGDIETLLNWLDRLPPGAYLERAQLKTTLAWALAHQFRFSECKQLLNDIKDSLSGLDSSTAEDLTKELKAVSAINEFLADRPHAAKALAEQLLNSLPELRAWVTGLVCNVLSSCYLMEGRYTKALDVQKFQHKDSSSEPYLIVNLYHASIMGQVFVRQGDLNTGLDYYKKALEQTETGKGKNLSGRTALAVQAAEVFYEQGEWQILDSLLRDQLDQIDSQATLDGVLRSYRALIRRAVTLGDYEGADSLQDRALRLATKRSWLRLRAGILAERLRTLLARRRLEDARGTLQQLKAHSFDISTPHPDPSEQDILDFYQLGQSCFLLATAQYEAAISNLETLTTDLQRRGRLLATVHIRTLLAIAYWNSGKHTKALDTLNLALKQGRKQALLSSFLDAGHDLLPLLRKLLTTPDVGEIQQRGYVQKLADQLQRKGETDSPHWLSEREQQILSLLGGGQTNKEIARYLEISTDTVKWHLKNLFSKLGVTNRTQALKYALDNGLSEVQPIQQD